PVHTPAPSQVVVPTWQVLRHTEPAGSNLQVDEQQSPLRVLPSSQSSVASTMPLPQMSAFFAWTANCVGVTPADGRPGPFNVKKFCPQGLPVIVCGTSGMPSQPVGGAGAVASHVRNGPTRPDSGPLKLTGEKAPAKKSESSVKVMKP